MRRVMRLFLIIMIVLFCIASIGIMCGAVVLNEYAGSRVSEELLDAARSFDETRFYYFEHDDR